MSFDDDDDLVPPPNPAPLFLGHVLGVLTHLLAGVSTALFLVFGPALHPLAGDPLTVTRFWLGGIVGFSTLVALFFSTVFALVAFRVISMFLTARGAPVRAAMLLGVMFAHGVGCTAGVIGSGVAVFGTVFGEHGGPWTERDGTIKGAKNSPEAK